MAATTLSAGDIAIISYQADSPDSLSFVLLHDIGSGTQIFFSDRNWNGTAFPGAGSGDGTVTYTAGADLAAGTVITISAATLSAGGSTFDHTTGDTIYAYQGTNANTPTTFLYAVDFADGNTTFNGNLTGTGLTNGVTAVAVPFDNASYAGPTTYQAGLQLSPGSALITDISNFNEWIGNDNQGQTALVQPPQGTFLDAPEVQVWTVGSGGGEVIAHVDNNNGANSGSNLVQLLTNKTINIVTSGGTVVDAAGLRGAQDIAIDPVHDRYFVADTDGVNDRILEGKLSDLLNNPGATQTLRQLYAEPAVADGGIAIVSLTIDPNNGQLFFAESNKVQRINYSVSGTSTVDQTPVTLGSVGVAGTNFIKDIAIDFVHGTVIASNSTVQALFGADTASTNYIWRADGLTSGTGAGGLSFSQIPFSPDDDDGTGTNQFPLSGEAFPIEHGTVFGVDIDPVTQTLYFTTRSISTDDDGDGGASTPNVMHFGGVWSYALTGNPTGTYTNIYQQNGVTGVTALLHYIEVDQSGNYYVTGLGTGSEAIYIDSVVAGGAVPAKFSDITNINALGPHGVVIDYAPTLALALGATPTYTETAGTPSAAGTAVSLNITATANDIDAVDVDEDLAGAIVRISSNFLSGASHQDFLTVNGDADGVGTIAGSGINFSYNSTLGVLTLSGTATFAEYKAALELVQFTSSGDNPTDYGAKNNRTISWSVNDGLLSSSEQTSTINITAVNDNPVNGSLPTLNGAGSVTEDTGKQITFSVSDVDADPANQNITVRLQVTQGTIDINTAVVNGLTAGQVTGDNTNDVLLTGTQNQINATLANATGAVYHNTPDYNGADTLTITTNDLGNTGTPGATTDVDVITININAVVDIANDTPTIAEDAGATTIDVLANDTFENPGRAITAVGTASHGTVTINDNGTPGVLTDDFVVYTPTADYNGSDSFTYTVTSGGVTEQAAVNVTITAVADINNDTVIVDEDSGANSLNLLANDTFENPSRAITAVGAALHGTTAINDNSTPGDATDDFVVYTPNANYNGSDSFTYTVTSPAGVTEQATVNVTVNAVNDPVTTNAPASATLAEDSVDFAVTGLSIADVDATLAPAGVYEVTLSATQGVLTLTTIAGLTFTGGSDGTNDATMTFHGTLSAINTALATAKYTPNANYNGSAQITLQATDTFGGIVATGSGIATSDSDNVAVTVSAVNDPVTGTAPANLSATEDGGSVAVTGLSISDVDATLAPAGVYEVTLSASQGTLTLSTTTGLTFTGGSDGTADATMTFHGTLSDINTAVATATYAPNANFNGSDTIVFAVTDTFGGIVATGTGIATSDSDNVAVTVSAVNDPVTSSAPAAATVVEDVATAITGLSISDVDANLAPAGVYEVTLSATNGTLTMTTLAGLTFTGGSDGTDDATMTFHGTLSAINTALATTSYKGASNFNGSAQISINVTDTFGGIVATGTGIATSDSDTINVTVSAANDPVTSNAPASASGDEDAGPIAITGLSIADVDATLAPGGIYSVTLTATNGTLTLTTLTGLTFTGGSDGTADATMTFTGTLSDINTALATASYTPAPNFAGPATVSISVTDDVGGTIATGSGIATSDSDNVNVTVNAVNDPPAAVIDQASYSGTPGVDIDLKGELSVSDIDAAAGSVTVTLSVNSATAVLTVTTGGSGAGVAGSGGNSVTITGTIAQINDLLNTDGASIVTFADTTGGTKTLTLAIDDNGFTGSPGNLTAQDTASILLDEPPTITGTGQTVSYTEQQTTPAAVVIDNDLVVADPDAPGAGNQINSGTVQITVGFVSGDLLAADTTGTSISATWNAGTQTLELTGADTLANYQQVLRTVTFTSPSDDPTDGGASTSRTVTWIVKDIFDAASSPVTSTVSVAAVNDGPTNTVPGAQSTNEDTSLTFTGATAISIADPDSSGNDVTVTLTVLHGTLTFSGPSGPLTSFTNGLASISLTGTAAEINAALVSLTYAPTADYYGSDSLSVFTSDNGATGGGAITDTDSVTITITADADIANDSATIAEDAAATTIDVFANDTFENSGRAVTAVGTASHGTVTIDTHGDADPTNDSVVYTPTADYNGADSFTYTVTSGGVTETATVNVTITADADIANDGATIAEDAGATTIDVFANDTFENSGRAVTAVGTASHGTVTIDTHGDADPTNDSVVYTPTADYNGTDSFTYTVTSGGVTETATVNVTITAVTDIANDSATIAEDAGATTIDVFANDTFENSGRAVTAVGTASHGTVTIDTHGDADPTNDSVVYTPTADYNGTDSFTYTVTSGGVTETATVNVTVTAVADIADDNVSVNEDSGASSLNLLANDTFENSGRAITAVGAALHGTATINTNGNADPTDDFVVYTPNGNYNGPDSFTYTVTSAGVTETATVNVTVNAVNDVPVLNGLTDTPAFIENGASVLLDTNGNAAVSDPELNAAGNYAGATLTLQRSGGPNSDDSFGATGTLDLIDSNGLGENVSLDGGTTFIGTFVDLGDGSISFTFNANATAAGINDVMRQIVYSNASDNPPTVVPINFIFNDGNGLPSGQAQGTGAGVTTATVNVQVTQVNDRPLLGNVAAGAAYTIGSAGVVLSPSLLVSDVDAVAPSTNIGIKNAVAAISDGYLPGDQLFVNLPAAGIFFQVDDDGDPLTALVTTNISVQSSSFGRLVLTGTDTPLHYQLVLDAVSYKSTATDPTDNGLYGTRTISWQVNDGAALTAPLLTAPGPTYATSGSPFEGVTLDVNHDDVLDVVVTTAAGISVLLGNGDGTFGTKTDTNFGNSPRDIAAADLNHDGNADLAVAGFAGGVTVLLGNGAGGFTASPIIPTGSGPTGVAIADFNQDGHADLVVANAISNNVTVLFGTGTGTFAAIPNITVGTTPVAVTTGDFNGDGRIDIAAADQTSNDVAILLNNGVGGFAAAATFTTGAGTAPIQIATADLNGDGRLDLVTANSSGNNISVLLGLAGGAFGGPTTFATGNQPHDVTIGDVDGDGFLDVVTADVTGTGISFLHGNGNGTFATAAPFAAGPGAAATMLGDYDRNGALDVAVVNFSVSNISVLLGNGTNNNAPASTLLQFDQPPAVDLDGVAAGTGFVTTFTENGAAVAIANAPTISDPDTASVSSVNIVLTNAKAGDVLSVVGALPAGIDSSVDTSVPGQITLTLFNPGSFADYQTALGQVRFSNTTENPDTTDRDITVEAIANEGHSNLAHATVHVIGVNDAPVNTVPGAQSTLPNTNKVIAGLAVSDPDAASGSLTTTLSVLHGILTVSSAGGAAIAGSGTASVTLTGTLAQINTTLSASNNIVYKSDVGFNGSDTLTVLSNDGGNTGTGGAQSDSDAVSIVVSAPPTITSNGGGDTATVNILERTNAVTTVTATDPDSPTLTYSIIGGSDSGKFQINASTGALSFITPPNFDVPNDTDHNNSYIVQVQASDGVLTDSQTLTVQVIDNPNINSTVHWIKSVDPGVHPAGWNPAGIGDFNGDGTSDLAWFNPTTGNLDIWKLSNGGWAGSSNVGSHPLGYQPVGFGDYNGDHTSDVLWYNPTTRDVDLWKISNGQWAGSVNIGTHPAGFTPSLSGDFNGDGTSDILWFNPTTNAVDIWKIDTNGNWAGSVNLGTHPAGFTPAAAGDFNGDGTSDVLWYNPTNGQVDIWNLSNAQWAGSSNVGAHPLGWQPLGAADFNLDGTSDVAWHNPTTNNIEVWLIENSHWSETANIGSHPPGIAERGGLLPTPPQFVPVVAVGVGDFDHNGVADIMWQDNGNKHIDNWLLDYS